MRTTLLLGLALALPGAPPAAAGEDHWPQWRGPDANGVARGSAPTTWGDRDGVKWSATLPGRGFSTPVVWGERIFVTTAVPTEEGGSALGAPGEHRFLVVCLRRSTGDVLWKEAVTTATPHEGHQPQSGSFASISPVTDGERVYCSFGSRGIYCLGFDGEPVWKRDAGVELEIRRQFGEGAGPVLAGGLLIHPYDHEGDSFVVALDARDGKERWRTPRDEPTTWSTPLFVELESGPQVVLSGVNRVRGYALDTGEEVWRCAGLGNNPVPTPLWHADTVLAMSGVPRSPALLAIELGREGDLSGTDAVRWSTSTGVPYVPTPALYEGRMYTVKDGGFLSCLDAATGAPHYLEERLPRGSRVKASPLVAGGKLYVATENGAVHVIEAGTEYELVATNTLRREAFIASPVAAEGELLLRGRNTLYCIAD